MMYNKTINILALLLVVLLFSSCDEDFDLVTEYKDQTVIYAFLEHKDPWGGGSGVEDTNWVVVNKAFLGEANVNDMAGVADSVNYSNYDEISVTLQRIESIDPNSATIGAPIVLAYTKHYKDPGIFATDNNIVFYTTEALMDYQDVNLNPRPIEGDSYFYKIAVQKPGKELVYATTKMIRGLKEGKPMTFPESNRYIEMASLFPNYTFKVEFESNLDARVYDFKIRTYYYEKRTDGNIYLDYVDYQHPMVVTRDKAPKSAQEMEISIAPLSYFANFGRQLLDTVGVEWRIPKIRTKGGLEETHSLHFTLGSQETYIYNQITLPSDGIVQEKPTYTNITNGLGLFTSKWNFMRDNFKISNGTVDSLAYGMATKDLKFQDITFTSYQNDIIHRDDVIKRY